MRIRLWLAAPGVEIVVQTGRDATRYSGAYRGRAVFTDTELDQVLNQKPSPSEFRAICAAKVAVSGRVVAVDGRFTPEFVDDSYDDVDELFI